jgi:hypothetical protein
MVVLAWPGRRVSVSFRYYFLVALPPAIFAPTPLVWLPTYRAPPASEFISWQLTLTQIDECVKCGCVDGLPDTRLNITAGS